MRDYLGEVTLAELVGPEEKEKVMTLERDRQRQYLKRKDAPEGTRPVPKRQRLRKSSYQWLAGMHNMLANWIVGGLLWFCVSEVRMAGSPRLWPRLAVSPDMGSDNVCPLSYLQRKIRACIDVAWDFSTGATMMCLQGSKGPGYTATCC